MLPVKYYITIRDDKASISILITKKKQVGSIQRLKLENCLWEAVRGVFFGFKMYKKAEFKLY